MFRFLFYPGVIMHEFAHLFACLILRVKVSKLSFGLHESYVKHEATGPVRMSLIALAPFYFGFFIGCVLFYFAKISFASELIWFFVLNYLGICVLYNSIPSSQDTKNIFNTIEDHIKKQWKKSLADKLLLILLILFIYVPIFIIAQLVSAFDKFEILRAFYVLCLFAFVYGLL
jgi:hypothetical protein